MAAEEDKKKSEDGKETSATDLSQRRLEGGYWPIGMCSRRNVLSTDDMKDILNKVHGTKKSLKVLDGLQMEISRICSETTVSMLAIMSAGNSDELPTIRRRKAELEEETVKVEFTTQLILTRDRLCITAEDMMRMKAKMSILQSENSYLRKQLGKTERGSSPRHGRRKSKKRGEAGGNDDTTDEDSTGKSLRGRSLTKQVNRSSQNTNLSARGNAIDCDNSDVSNSSSYRNKSSNPARCNGGTSGKVCPRSVNCSCRNGRPSKPTHCLEKPTDTKQVSVEGRPCPFCPGRHENQQAGQSKPKKSKGSKFSCGRFLYKCIFCGRDPCCMYKTDDSDESEK